VLESALEGLRFIPRPQDFFYAPVQMQDLGGTGFLFPSGDAQRIRLSQAALLSFAAALADVQKPVSFAATDGTKEEISAEERYFRDLEASAVDPRFAANFTAKAPAHAATQDNASPVDITAKL
jgi:hypothetical protein